jgi:hypothetical protein
LPDRIGHSVIKIFVIIIGIAYSLKLIGFIKISDTGFFSYALPIYGIVAVYFSFNTNRKAFLFFSTAVFMTGVLFYVLENFNIFNSVSLILPAIIFILGSCFIILYLENFSNKIFLYVAITLILFSTFFILMYRFFFVKRGLTALGNIFLDYYPILIVFAGIMILTKNKK